MKKFSTIAASLFLCGFGIANGQDLGPVTSAAELVGTYTNTYDMYDYDSDEDQYNLTSTVTVSLSEDPDWLIFKGMFAGFPDAEMEGLFDADTQTIYFLDYQEVQELVYVWFYSMESGEMLEIGSASVDENHNILFGDVEIDYDTNVMEDGFINTDNYYEFYNSTLTPTTSTAVDKLTTSESEGLNIYTLQGIRINADNTTGLSNGLYIINGKKVVIRK